MSKEEALKEAEETKRKVTEWKAASESTVERLGKEKADLQAQVSSQAKTLKELTDEVTRYKDYEALAAVVDRIVETKVKRIVGAAGGSSIDYDQLAAEVARRMQGRGDIDIEALASILLPKVLEKVPTSSGVKYIPAPPRTVILKSFMEAEVSRLEEKLKASSAESKRVIAYLQARGTHSIKRDLITHVFGPSSTSGAGYTKVSKFIDEALATELIREDRTGRLYPNLNEKVEADLKPYEASKEDADAVVERMMYLVTQKETQAPAVAP